MLLYEKNKRVLQFLYEQTCKRLNENRFFLNPFKYLIQIIIFRFYEPEQLSLTTWDANWGLFNYAKDW